MPQPPFARLIRASTKSQMKIKMSKLCVHKRGTATPRAKKRRRKGIKRAEAASQPDFKCICWLCKGFPHGYLIALCVLPVHCIHCPGSLAASVTMTRCCLKRSLRPMGNNPLPCLVAARGNQMLPSRVRDILWSSFSAQHAKGGRSHVN